MTSGQNRDRKDEKSQHSKQFGPGEVASAGILGLTCPTAASYSVVYKSAVALTTPLFFGSPINVVRESPLLATFLRLLAPYEYRVRMRWRS